MLERLKALKAEAEKEILSASTLEELELLRVKYLGRKAVLTQMFAVLKNLDPVDRALTGRELNSVKGEIEDLLSKKKEQLQMVEDYVDLSLPAKKIPFGTKHILSVVNEQICDIFVQLGFEIIEGGEIEDEWHNFTALNIPLEHPSRDVFDTFYLDLEEGPQGKFLLRSHTSPSQIRVMQTHKPPLAVISPGRVYRPDQVDATHSFMFHQIEGFCVSEEINFSHLKGVLLSFAQRFFSEDVKLRFRPHFFPFTEPSAEVDVSCIICHQTGRVKEERCSVCKGKGWVEILGCGMIHPKVLEVCGIDPRRYCGFAFGMGVERITMLKYSIDDIRLFYENDERFLTQFYGE